MKITNPLTSAPQGKVPESAAMKNLFDGFDKDKDRALNEAEFTTFAKSMGLDPCPYQSHQRDSSWLPIRELCPEAQRSTG
jgi:hypothetical protein